MDDSDQKIQRDFIRDSLRLTQECGSLLRELQGQASKAAEFEVVSNKMDRIMGAARMLSQPLPSESTMHLVAENSACAKKIARQGMRTDDFPDLFEETRAFLVEVVAAVAELLGKIETPVGHLPGSLQLSKAEAMKALVEKHYQIVEGRVPTESTISQFEIDSLLKKKN